jgi:branched-chain amino acid transport system substrate-binding protein
MKIKTLFHATLLSSALGVPAAFAQDISIAVVGPMTGPLANIGDQFKQGAQAAAAAINAKGGVLPAADQYRDRGRRLRSQAGCLGRQPHRRPKASSSSTAMPAPARASRPRRSMPKTASLMMTPASSNPELTDAAAKGWPTIMRLYTRDDAQGAFIGPWIAKKYRRQERRRPARQERLRPGRRRRVKATMNEGGLN